MHPRFLLAISTAVFASMPLFAQAQESLLDNPAIRAVADALKSKNSVVTTRTIQEYRTVYSTEYYYCGRVRRRLYKRLTCRRIPVARTRSVVRSMLDDGIGWQDTTDPRLGFYQATVSVLINPASVGARASKVDRVANKVQGDVLNVKSEFGAFDRELVRSPAVVDTVGARTLIRIEALIAGADDNSIEFNVKIQKRDAAGNLVDDKKALDAEAQSLWVKIANGLKN